MCPWEIYSDTAFGPMICPRAHLWLSQRARIAPNNVEGVKSAEHGRPSRLL